jgi:hypothetical protein
MKFKIENEDKLEEWISTHRCQFTKPGSTGAIGGRLTYMFTPTGLGCISIVRCACGGEIDCTNYDKW